MLGLVVAALGCSYVVAARAESVTLFRASIYVRTAVAVAFAALVALGTAPASLLIFVGVELVGAAWTLVALRRSSGSPPLRAAEPDRHACPASGSSSAASP